MTPTSRAFVRSKQLQFQLSSLLLLQPLLVLTPCLSVLLGFTVLWGHTRGTQSPGTSDWHKNEH